jgi:hypothetical protein
LRCHIVCRRLADEDEAQYSMLLCNETNIDADVRAFVPDTQATPYRTVMETSIAPYSNLSTTVALDLEPTGAVPEIHLALTNGDVQLLFSIANHSPDLIPFALSSVGPVAPTARPAAAPPGVSAERGRSRPSPAIAPMLLPFVALLVIAAVFAFRPRVTALDVPRDAAPGADVSVSYQALGLGAADYALLGPEGRTIAAGPLAPGDGHFSVTAPRAATPQTYLVRVRISNLFESAMRDDYVRVPATAALVAVPRPRHVRASAAPAAPVMIRSFAIDRATLASGQVLNVSYDVLAATGSLVLSDPAAQITYTKDTLNSSGHASFIAPQTDTTRLLSVVITATRGAATAQSRISVTVTPQQTPAPRDAGTSAGTGDPGTTAADEEFPLVDISAPSVVRSGASFHVEVHGAGPGLQLVLLAGNGEEVARHDLGAGSSGIDFAAPLVRARTRIILEALYQNSLQSAPVVRSITVTP